MRVPSLVVCERVERGQGAITLVNVVRGIACEGFPIEIEFFIYAIIEDAPSNKTLSIEFKFYSSTELMNSTKPENHYVHPEKNGLIEILYQHFTRVTNKGRYAIAICIDGVELNRTQLEFIDPPLMI